MPPNSPESGSLRHRRLGFPAALGLGDEFLLGVEALSLHGAEVVETVRIHDTRLHIVLPEPVDDLLNVRLDAGIADRESRLDTPEEVARHPVGAAEIDFGGAAVLKAHDAAVLKEAPDQAPDLDILADARDAGSQAADAADQQAHPDAGL